MPGILRGAANASRNVETGAALGVLVLVLAVTGFLLSPTVSVAVGFSGAQAGGGNALYAIHLAAAALLVAFTLWHLLPLAYAFSKKAGRSVASLSVSHALLALVLVEVVTGYALWMHDYRLVGKATAVKTHLVVTFVLLVPIAPHAWHGLSVWRGRHAARRHALEAATQKGKRDVALAAQQEVSRRAFMRIAGYFAAGAALAYAFGRQVSEQIAAWRVNSVGETPAVPKSEWRLLVTGLVKEPVEITYRDLLAMGPVDLQFTHHCVEGWTYTDEFTGVPLRKVIERAGGVLPGATQLVLKSAEISTVPETRGRRYTTNFPVADGLHDDVLLVIGVGGVDLPLIHGGPVRVMTPRKWGYKACKWLNEIEVIGDASYRGYWERVGYHNDGDYPGPIFG